MIWFILAIIIILLVPLIFTKLKKEALKITSEEFGAYGHLKHTVGLSIPENTMCKLHLSLQGLDIESNGVSFNLPRNRILDITVKSEEEIQKQLVSSAGGAVAGGMLFGALGAMVGGKTKEKKISTVKKYLIFIYEKDNNPEYIAFDTTKTMDYINFTTYFEKYMKKGNMKVDL